MRRHVLTVAAVVAFAALVVAVVAVAVSSASGTPGGAKLGTPSPPRGRSVSRIAPPDCELPDEQGPSAIPVGGVCTGELTGEFRCAKSGEELALSIRRPLGERRVFYLTVFVRDYTGPGGYPESEAFVQITGLPEVLRWTQRDAITRVDPAGFVDLGRFLFKPEPGTPATGTILLQGRAACATAERGSVTVRRH